MARIASHAVAGYYPTPKHLLASIASTIELPEPPSWRARYPFLDPCAATGEALLAIATSAFEPHYVNGGVAETCFGIELEGSRYRALSSALGKSAFHGDAFHFAWSQGSGAGVLYLNPPYDVDRECGRTEERFLRRFTGVLDAGGALIFVVPRYALAASARTLAANYTAIRLWRFPDPDYQAFRQVVLVGRRRDVPSHPDPRTLAMLERAAVAGDELEVLPPIVANPLRVAPADRSLSLQPLVVDVTQVLQRAKPFAVQPSLFGYDRDARQLLGAPMQVALPPRPAHIALALSAGLLNGRKLEPNQPGRFPTLMAKGTFKRDLITIEKRHNSEGVHTGDVKVQRPRLDMRVLRLDNRTFHALRLGTEPSGATDVEEFNTADLLVEYSDALARLVREQLPPIHDPTVAGAALQLPATARTPFRTQAACIHAGLKLIARGETPQLIAEVGTGKSTVALTIVNALSPANLPALRAELLRQGLPVDRLRPVHRTLIVCPPHLLDSWADQIHAVLPAARVHVVAVPSDLDVDADFYVLSRETAKLGSGIAGVAGERCPRCSAPLEGGAASRATARARCVQPTPSPAAGLGDVARLLALKVYPYLEPEARARAAQLLVDHPAAAARANRPVPPAPFNQVDLAHLEPALRAVVLQQLERGNSYTPEFRATFTAVALCARLQDGGADLRSRLAELAAAQPYSYSTPGQALTVFDEALKEHFVDRSALLHRLFAGLLQSTPWLERPGCGEPLHWMTADPRRYALARYILRRKAHLFDFLILDEVHEFATTGSAQSKAAHRLVEMRGVPTLALSGSIMGGFASSLFANAWALQRGMRSVFDRDDKAAFVARYGYRKFFVSADAAANRGTRLFGSRTDREADASAAEIRQLGEAPGISPLYVLEHVLPTGLIMHKADLDDGVPPCTEEPTPVPLDLEQPFDRKLLAEAKRLHQVVGSQIAHDRRTPLAGLLFGAFGELPSYLDHAAEECGPYEVAYPADAGGAIVATGEGFPSSWRSPKERWMLSTVAGELARGRKVMIFLRHTGSPLFVRRLLRLLLEELGEPAVFLDPIKVQAKKRERWIDQHVVAMGRRVLLVHPKAVETGLNNLVYFSTGIWYEGADRNARTTRQANGRLHRIGQTNDVRLLYPYYATTLQETALGLIARKVTASEQVDGLSIEGALEAAGASDATDREHADAALAFGQALYRAAA